MYYPAALLILVSLSSVCSAQEPRKRTEEVILGSAFFISKEGHLLTCEHCVRDKLDYTIFFQNQAHPVKIIFKDAQRDVAILKINANTSEYLTLCGVEIPQGSEVRTFGYPLAFALGDQIKVTRGTIAGTAKVIRNIEWLQIDASINPGNSGGALVDEGGLVVGITNAKLRPELGQMGFAVPVHEFRPLLDKQRISYETKPKADKLEGPALVKKVASSVVPLMAKPPTPIAQRNRLPTSPNTPMPPPGRQELKKQEDGFFDLRNSGGHFSDEPDIFGPTVRHVEGKETILIGFKVNVDGNGELRGLQPIYLKNNREHYGTVIGDVIVSSHVLQARSGYAVSAIHVHNSLHISKMQLIFSKIKGGNELDTKDSYSSNVAGNQSLPLNSKRDSGGKPVVGIHGVTNNRNWPIRIGMVVSGE